MAAHGGGELPPRKVRCRSWAVLRPLLALLAVVLLAKLGEYDAHRGVRIGGGPLRTAGAGGGRHERRPTFWFIWSKDMDSWHWAPWGAVESVFKFHPNARVHFLSRTMPLDFFSCLSAAGYNIDVQRYDLREITKGTSLEKFIAAGKFDADSNYKYAHESDLVRLLVLYKYGGIYMDTDMLLLRPLDAHVTDYPVFGVETYHDPKQAWSPRLNNAFIGFPRPGHEYLEHIMESVQTSYNPKEWAAIGPDLVSQTYQEMYDDVKAEFHLLAPRELYPMHWSRAWYILQPNRMLLDQEWPKHFRNMSYAVHLYNSNSWNNIDMKGESLSYYRLNEPPPGSYMAELMEKVRLHDVKCEHLNVGAKEARDRLAQGLIPDFSDPNFNPIARKEGK